MAAVSGHANYEDVSIGIEHNGEFVRAASGRMVMICRSGGAWIVKATFSGHYASYPEGAHAVGTVFTYLGVEFVVESLSIQGHHAIQGTGNGGTEIFDPRKYEVGAVSTIPLSSATIHLLKAGESG